MIIHENNVIGKYIIVNSEIIQNVHKYILDS